MLGMSKLPTTYTGICSKKDNPADTESSEILITNSDTLSDVSDENKEIEKK
jgi:hypothetical protein